MSLDLLTAPKAAPPRDPSPRRWTDAEFARMKSLGIVPANAEFAEGTVEIPDKDGDWVPFVFTRKEYYALDDHHFFHDQRVQLIAGVIQLELPMNPPHATGIRLGTKTFHQLYAGKFEVSVQLPVDLGLISEPHPDFAIIAGSHEDYAEDHPKSALLIVEVSDSTLIDDLTDKASLYAAGGIQHYWVIDVNDRVLHVLTEPVTDDEAKHGYSYNRIAEFSRNDAVAVPGLPGTTVEVSRLVP